VLPTLFHFGHLSLPTFGALAALGLMLALVLSERTAALAGVNAAKLWDAGIFAVVAAFVLSRLLLLIEYWSSFARFPVLVLTVPSLTPVGLLLTLAATTAWLRVRHVPLPEALDAWAPCAMLVWGCLALGHFAEGSDPGMPTALPWGLPPMRGEAVRLHPVALYVAVVAFGLAFVSYRQLSRRLGPGAAAGRTLVWAGVAQFLLTFVRQPGQSAWLGLERLEWVALGMILAGAGLVANSLRAERKD
jgi:phosphatidylglycerol:prolipoprotein diacylglycerol transferase